jgi:hypothetical protein
MQPNLCSQSAHSMARETNRTACLKVSECFESSGVGIPRQERFQRGDGHLTWDFKLCRSCPGERTGEGHSGQAGRAI